MADSLAICYVFQVAFKRKKPRGVGPRGFLVTAQAACPASERAARASGRVQ
ncbi:hypothetical protein C7S17_0754 [Burkholderia thailandensis]|nr:hypothetical protein [Burkholderia thailandensis]